jgi:Tfp pilus assembly protein FimT
MGNASARAAQSTVARVSTGWSLIEMAIALAIAAALVVLGVPT